MSLPDVNVLVYAVDKLSPFNAPCAAWLVAALNGSEIVSFSWQSLLGFIRITTNPRAMKSPLSVSDACDYVESWLHQPMSKIVEPLDTHSSTLRRMLVTVGSGGNTVSDAHLAAIAIDHNVELVSCDTDLPGFRD